MKTIICLIILGIAVVADAQVEPPKHGWKATLKVVDETGQPISGASIRVYYGTNEIAGLSDANGMFIASHRDASEELVYQAGKPEYYPCRISYHLGRNPKAGKWNPQQIIVLKKIINPIPMYAKYVEGGPPVFNQPVGYDLMVGDWVAPHGKGKTGDIIFTGDLSQKAKNDFDYTLTVSFPGKGDGIQEFSSSSADAGSALRSSQQAPTNAYRPKVVRTMSRHPGSGTKEDMNNPAKSYYFRIRTVLDERGNVIRTLYGKIYGDFMQFRYYLNPTPNDPDVEFDPTKNLVKNLKPLEAVKEP